MKTFRFCLSFTLAFFTLVLNLHAARLPETDQTFQAAFIGPENSDLPLLGVASWLGIGAALGWLLLSLSVGFLARQEQDRILIRK